MSPFDYLNSLNDKRYLFDRKFDSYKEYSQFLINKGLSFYKDTVLLANEMNIHPPVDNKMHYDFFYHGIEKKKRFSKWFKSPKSFELAKTMAEHYNVSVSKAEEMLSVLTPEQIEEYKELFDKGG